MCGSTEELQLTAWMWQGRWRRAGGIWIAPWKMSRSWYTKAVPVNAGGEACGQRQERGVAIRRSRGQCSCSQGLVSRWGGGKSTKGVWKSGVRLDWERLWIPCNRSVIHSCKSPRLYAMYCKCSINIRIVIISIIIKSLQASSHWILATSLGSRFYCPLMPNKEGIRKMWNLPNVAELVAGGDRR